MVTGRDSVDDQVRALEVGADDYLTKTFLAQELAERVAVLLKLASRRSKLGNPSILAEELDQLYEGSIRLVVNITGSVRTAVEFVGELRDNQQFRMLRMVSKQMCMDISIRLPYPLPVKRLLLRGGHVCKMVSDVELDSTVNERVFHLSLA